MGWVAEARRALRPIDALSEFAPLTRRVRRSESLVHGISCGVACNYRQIVAKGGVWFPERAKPESGSFHWR
jgi:hypothetical protein